MILLYILEILLGLFLLYVLFLGVCSLLVNPEREYAKNSNFYRFLLDSATAAAMKLLRIRVHTNGMEMLPEDTKVLFVSNHRSNFDPIVTWYALKERKIAFVSKPSNFKIPFFGRIIRKCCFLPIDRENPRKAIVTINKAAKLLQKQEVSIGIYPEGTRSKTGQLLPFHNGVFKIAQKAESPIAVLSITGTEKISGRTPFQPTDVYLDVLEVFPGENIKESKTETIGMMVRHLILTNTEKRDVIWQKDM
ncbi:MAG: 1-acyl-sn-glycerol-3-phosphate acyltransferase [Ruminococcaceae bacterium]|nr:1-acyl-sn-glycerol-3-phosphate acyltransferase [Oscillospiraceae bacterium]